jgi:RNA polymerase sigma-70 factor (ECF subfamily)
MTENADSESEVFWVLRAQSGSNEALDQIFKVLQEPLFRYLRSLVREQSQAEDVLQEVFLRIYSKLKWLREPGALRPWAYQIATREAFRHLKKQQRLREEQDDGSMGAIRFEPHESMFLREMIAELPDLIGKLSPASRAVVALYYLHELSLSETAAVLEIPIGTVKSRLAYGLATLRREFEKGR